MKRSIRNISTITCLLIFAAVLFLIMAYATAPARAASSSSEPVTNLTPATKTVKNLRTVYVERINSRASYVEYNNGASQFVRNCSNTVRTVCVRPYSGVVVLEDGSLVRLARWVR